MEFINDLLCWLGIHDDPGKHGYEYEGTRKVWRCTRCNTLLKEEPINHAT